MISNVVSDDSKKILDTAFDHLDNTEDPGEFHLPKKVTDLEKPQLLALLYRVLSYTKLDE